MDKLKSTEDSFSSTSNNDLQQFIVSVKDEVFYATYQQNEIEDLIRVLMELGYIVCDDVWDDNEQCHHVIIDHSFMRVKLLDDNWLEIINSLKYPIYNLETIKELLPFYTK